MWTVLEEPVCILEEAHICMSNRGCSIKSSRIKECFQDSHKQIQNNLCLLFFFPLVRILSFLDHCLKVGCLVIEVQTKGEQSPSDELLLKSSESSNPEDLCCI